MQAAVGVAQLGKLNDFIKARKDNFKSLSKIFGCKGKYFTLPTIENGADPSWFGFPILIKENASFVRNEVVEYLENNKIATRMLFGGEPA